MTDDKRDEAEPETPAEETPAEETPAEAPAAETPAPAEPVAEAAPEPQAAEAPATPEGQAPDADEEDEAEEFVEETPRVKPEIPGMDLEVDIVREGERKVGGQELPRDPPNTVGAEELAGQAASASRTAAACGPSSGRPSCAP